MANVTATIGVQLDAGQALAQLRALQAEMQAFGTRQAAASSAVAAQNAAMNKRLIDGINATRLWSAQMVNAQSHVDRFSKSLDQGKLSMGEYFRYGATQSRLFRRAFIDDFNTIDRLARERVKTLQTQYVAMGRAADGTRQALAIRPSDAAMNWGSAATQMAVAAQKQQIYNRLMRDGSTAMVNWGKNTQWAGRQLMVGFSIPLGIAGGMAAKTFMELEKAGIQFKRVYGDLSTPTAEVEKNLKAVQDLGSEYAKYGISIAQTMEVAARAAATGLQNEDLLAGTEQTLRLATLGQMDYNQALEATITLQTAFGIGSKDLGKTIDYLNAAENQTILSLDDITKAIPRVAPVIKGLGGNVQDLAVMMTALREGGVTAEQGANALKSGLGSLINPTDTATKFLKSFGINITKMVKDNKGDLMGMVTGFGEAISKLSNFDRQRVLEKLFGKYQYARMGALFKNLARDGSQAARALELAGMSTAELASLSERELSKISDSVTFRFTAAIERFKLAVAPLGEIFLEAVTPIIDFGTRILDAFNQWPDGVKTAVTIVTAAIAGIAPIALMTFGLIANGFGNMLKGINFVRGIMNKMRGRPAGSQTMEQLQDAAMVASLEKGTSAANVHTAAVERLSQVYMDLASSAASAGSAISSALSAGTPQSRAAMERAHLTLPMANNSEAVQAAIASKGLGAYANQITAHSNLMAEVPLLLNQRLRDGVGAEDFEKMWDSRQRKLLVSAGIGGADITDKELILAEQQMSDTIKKKSLALAASTQSGLVNDEILAQATQQAIADFKIMGGAAADLAIALESASQQVGQLRLKIGRAELDQMVSAGTASLENGVFRDANGVEIGRVGRGGRGARPATYNMPGGYAKRSESILADERVAVALTEQAAVVEAETQSMRVANQKIIAEKQALVAAIEAEIVQRKEQAKKDNLLLGPARARLKQGKYPSDAALPNLVAAEERSAAAEQELAAMNQRLTAAKAELVAATEQGVAAAGQSAVADKQEAAASTAAAEADAAEAEASVTAARRDMTEAGVPQSGGAMSGKFGRYAFGAGMALDAASMAMMFSGNETLAGIGQAVMPIGMLVNVLSMIPAAAAPAVAAFGGVAIALGAVGYAFKSNRDSIDAAASAAEQFGRSISVVGDTFNDIAKEQSKQTAVQRQQSRTATQRSKILSRLAGLPKIDSRVGEDFFSTSSGQQMLQEIRQANAGLGSEQAGRILGERLAQLRASGIIGKKQQNGILDFIGKENANLAIKANAVLEKIIGPDGSDLQKNPLEVSVRLTAAAGRRAGIQLGGQAAESTIPALDALNYDAWDQSAWGFFNDDAEQMAGRIAAQTTLAKDHLASVQENRAISEEIFRQQLAQAENEKQRHQIQTNRNRLLEAFNNDEVAVISALSNKIQDQFKGQVGEDWRAMWDTTGAGIINRLGADSGGQINAFTDTMRESIIDAWQGVQDNMQMTDAQKGAAYEGMKDEFGGLYNFRLAVEAGAIPESLTTWLQAIDPTEAQSIITTTFGVKIQDLGGIAGASKLVQLMSESGPEIRKQIMLGVKTNSAGMGAITKNIDALIGMPNNQVKAISLAITGADPRTIDKYTELSRWMQNKGVQGKYQNALNLAFSNETPRKLEAIKKQMLELQKLQQGGGLKKLGSVGRNALEVAASSGSSVKRAKADLEEYKEVIDSIKPGKQRRQFAIDVAMGKTGKVEAFLQKWKAIPENDRRNLQYNVSVSGLEEMRALGVAPGQAGAGQVPSQAFELDANINYVQAGEALPGTPNGSTTLPNITGSVSYTAANTLPGMPGYTGGNGSYTVMVNYVGTPPGRRVNAGGWINLNDGNWVPGNKNGPNKDSVPAMLTPGEFVVTRNQAQKHRGLLEAINAGREGFNLGGRAGYAGGDEVNRNDVRSSAGIDPKSDKMYIKLLAKGFTEQMAQAILSLDQPIKAARIALEGNIKKLKHAMAQRIDAENFISGIQQLADFFAQNKWRNKARNVNKQYKEQFGVGFGKEAMEALGDEGVVAYGERYAKPERRENEKKKDYRERVAKWKAANADRIARINKIAERDKRKAEKEEVRAAREGVQSTEVNSFIALKGAGANTDFLKKATEAGMSFEAINEAMTKGGMTMEEITAELDKQIAAQKEIEALSKTAEEISQERLDNLEKAVSLMDEIASQQQRINEATANQKIIGLTGPGGAMAGNVNISGELNEILKLGDESAGILGQISQTGLDMRGIGLMRENIENRIAQIQREEIDSREKSIAALNDQNSVMQHDIDKTNESYDAQFEALDRIAQREQQISALKQGQMSLADALSKGDIAAAARAAEEMRGQYSQYATDATRKALEAQRDAATLAKREAIKANDERIWALQREIYNVQQSQIAPLEEQLLKLSEVEQKFIDIRSEADLSTLTISSDGTNPLVAYWNAVETAARAAEAAARAAAAASGNPITAGEAPVTPAPVTPAPVDTGGGGGGGTTPPAPFDPMTVNGPKWQQFVTDFRAMGDSDQRWVKNKIFGGTERGENLKAWADLWPTFSEIRKNYIVSISSGGITRGERENFVLPMATGGLVPGIGNTDSVRAMLMPGEFVVNKMASAKFRGILEQMNSAAGPRFSLPAAAGGIQAGVYNNNAQYTVNVAVNGSNASADEIANAVLGRVQQFENMKIRSYSS